jgi:arylsulfatase A-like enzyme
MFRHLSIALAVVLFCCVSHAAGAPPLVVVISMDGVRWDYPDEPGLVALSRMQREGARAHSLVPVYPSNTFPGHVSLATGAHPDVHGIVDNVFNDRLRGRYVYSSDASWLRAEPIWIAAERQGVRAATYFWVGSETDWRGMGASYRMAPFDGTRAESLKVTQILDWLRLPEAERPQLIMSYFAGTDHVAHNRGPDGSAMREQLLAQDAQLHSLMQGIDALELWQRLTLVVVSDHGMTAMGDFVSLEDALADAGIAARVDGSTVAHVFLEDMDTLAQARTVLEAQDDRLTVIAGGEAASRFRFAAAGRTGDLVVLAEPPVLLQRPDGLEGLLMGALRFFGWDFGGHGYLPSHQDMHGVFLAMGGAVSAGQRLPSVHQVDVAPTVARLLGIEPPMQAEGQAIEALFTAPAGAPGQDR